MNLVGIFADQACRSGDSVAIADAAGEISYAVLQRRVDAAAAGFVRQGIGAGDRVLVLLGMGTDLYVTLLALLQIGAVAVFPDPSAAVGSVRYAAQACGLKAMAGGWKVRLLKWLWPETRKLPMLRIEQRTGSVPVAAVGDDHPALITFTSGSTGRPKGIVRSHGFLNIQHRMVREILDVNGGAMLVTLPVFLLSNLAAGVTSVLPAGDLRRPAALDMGALAARVAAYKVTRLLVPPVVCERLVQANLPLPTVTHVFTGGGPIFPDVMRGLHGLMPEAKLVFAYGSTEAEPIAHIGYDGISAADFAAMERGEGLLAGTPVPDVRLRLVEDEIMVTGGHVVKGYIDPTDNAGTKVTFKGEIWHRTGDAGRLDKQGRLWLLGRCGAAAGGVYPLAVETGARCVAGVVQVACVATTERAVLAYAGEAAAADVLRSRLTGLDVVRVPAIPMDRRHNSKVDYAALKQLLGMV